MNQRLPGPLLSSCPAGVRHSMLKLLRVLQRVLVLCLVAAGLLSCSKNNPTKPVAGGELNGSLPSTGSQYAHTFTNAGTFNYKCTIHPSCASLAGTIVVLAPGGVIQNRVLGITQSGGSSGPYGSTCASLSLQLDSVFVGDRIIWTNNSPLPHTVTSP
jgi:hypothetical protein